MSTVPANAELAPALQPAVVAGEGVPVVPSSTTVTESAPTTTSAMNQGMATGGSDIPIAPPAAAATAGTQPAAVAPMTATHQPYDEKSTHASSSTEYSAGFFDCFSDPGSCLMAWCCPCISYARNQDMLKNNKIHSEESGGSDCTTYALFQCCGVGWLLGFQGRKATREKYGINGEDITDLLAHCCCTPCALVQEEKEIKLRNGGPATV